MGKFRGWHIVAGIAAMVLTGILGTAMGLNNTGTFMSSCVAFVAVSLWADSRITRHRRGTAGERARGTEREAVRESPLGTAPETAGESGRQGDSGGGSPGPAAGFSLDADRPKPDGHGG